MIVAPTQSFYIIRATGEAAELITSVFSPGSMLDITDIVVLSNEFRNDIEPINELDASLEIIKSGLGSEVVHTEIFNPLYIPMSLDALDEVLENEGSADHMRFVGMGGNIFAVKSVTIESGENKLIAGTVSYQPFDLPSYETIMQNQTTGLLN
jgi:hypothetical protein